MRTEELLRAGAALDWAPLEIAIYMSCMSGCCTHWRFCAEHEVELPHHRQACKRYTCSSAFWAEHLILQGAQSTTMLGLGYRL